MQHENPTDTIESLAEELRGILMRAVKLGDQLAVNRVMTALGHAGSLNASIAQNQQQHIQDVVTAGPTRAASGDRAPQGSVRNMVREIIFAHPQGVLPSDIDEFAKASRSFEIKTSSRRMALLSLKAEGEIVQRDGKWFPATQAAETGAEDARF